MRIQQPNFIKTTIKASDIGSDIIKIKGQRVKLPFVVKHRDVGKFVAYNLNAGVKKDKGKEEN